MHRLRLAVLGWCSAWWVQGAHGWHHAAVGGGRPPPQSSQRTFISLARRSAAATVDPPPSNPNSSASQPQQQQQRLVRKAPSNDDGVGWDWRALAASVFENNSHPVILFDGVCNFCNGGVNLCLDWDRNGIFRYASLQSKVGQSLLLQSGRKHNDLSSIVLVTPTKAYFESDAILRIAEQLKGLPKWVRISSTLSRKTVPKLFRDAVYEVVAENRYKFGETDGPTCRVDMDESTYRRFIQDPEE